MKATRGVRASCHPMQPDTRRQVILAFRYIQNAAGTKLELSNLATGCRATYPALTNTLRVTTRHSTQATCVINGTHVITGFIYTNNPPVAWTKNLVSAENGYTRRTWFSSAANAPYLFLARISDFSIHLNLREIRYLSVHVENVQS